MEPIAHIHTDLPQKFGIPRNSFLAPHLQGRIVFEPEFASNAAVEGLDSFSHLWLLWRFENGTPGGTAKDIAVDAKTQDRSGTNVKWSKTVRPPRLGGAERVGVLATRSPFRPNPIGLTCVKLDRVELTDDGPIIHVLGADLRDGTPIYDIKPYIPFADCHPDATGGWIEDAPWQELDVEFPQALQDMVPPAKLPGLVEVLRQDPRRAGSKHEPNRIYHLAYAGLDISFTVDETQLTVVAVNDARDYQPFARTRQIKRQTPRQNRPCWWTIAPIETVYFARGSSMKYDFTSIIDRHGMDSIAVDSWGEIPGMAPNAPDEGFDRIPMWVADMNFATVPTVQEHIIQRAQHPMFGYFNPRAEYFDRIIEWQNRRNGVEGLSPEHIGYENGVLGGVVSTLRAYVQPGDAVLVHSPTYIGFTKSIEAAGYRIVHSPLKLDNRGVWRMDFEDMECKLAQNNIHAAVFCSPHNPCGRVWERDEIERAMDIYRQHDCVVISDEIWSDIILPGHKHIPTQSVSEDARMRTVALYAPSKTFNLAGLVGSYHIIYNETLRDRVCAVSNKTHYNEMNVLSMHALIGAYQPQGYEWLDELNQVLAGNIEYFCNYVDEHFEGVSYSRPQGTYMVFLDCAEWCREHGRDIQWLLDEGARVGVGYQDGRPFHGPCHIRVNLALPLSRVREACDRLDRYVFNAR